MFYNPLKVKRFVQKLKAEKMYKLHNKKCLRSGDYMHLFQRPLFGYKLLMVKDM